MTLIAVYKSSGDRGSVCVGRCDAKCYEATHPGCDCICGGANHGAGQDKAMDNTREMYTPWIARYEQLHSIENGQWVIPASQPMQASLF